MKRQPINIRYRRFGWLWALRPWSKGKHDSWQWLCWCLKCLRLCVVAGGHLRSGHSTMCDHCGNRAARKHGHVTDGKQSPTYNSWKNAKQRCHLRTATGFKYYGARDVQMCERWRDSFENFLADMGERPEGTTLGRLNDEGNYEPGNAFWQSAEEQAATQRRKAAGAGN